MTRIVTAGELLDGHVVLDIECLDRIYLNAYVPRYRSAAAAHPATDPPTMPILMPAGTQPFERRPGGDGSPSA